MLIFIQPTSPYIVKSTPREQLEYSMSETLVATINSILSHEITKFILAFSAIGGAILIKLLSHAGRFMRKRIKEDVAVGFDLIIAALFTLVVDIVALSSHIANASDNETKVNMLKQSNAYMVAFVVFLFMTSIIVIITATWGWTEQGEINKRGLLIPFISGFIILALTIALVSGQ